MNAEPSRQVGARLELQVHRPAEIALQVAVAAGCARESLEITGDSGALQAAEIQIGGNRAHLLWLAAGAVQVRYAAEVAGGASPAAASDEDRLTYLRPSRYAESDELAAVARAEFGGLPGHRDLLAAVSSWVGTQLRYVPGSSGPTDGAVRTLLRRQGVCRDYAHLVIALLRALDVPARLAAVYAPGLDPMDFHAVAEAMIDGYWHVVDATLLAPRASLVRIATGRDAADTAFLSAYGGNVELTGMEVTASTTGPLPGDDITTLIRLP